jgi:hypothetical protein
MSTASPAHLPPLGDVVAALERQPRMVRAQHPHGGAA